ncbi:hypothetical protein AVEN_213838-1 [Araneus ventricosus]|uniref:Uncharacterized protein n=1 Tax=Araneus ventricosus TaxID=182803 RepID=A0A4Y2JZH3_ARAVE|nr:hypothetical protein AVEN_213838-1 [Araneus ventricosus]
MSFRTLPPTTVPNFKTTPFFSIRRFLAFVDWTRIKRPPAGVMRKFGNWVPAQVSYSLSDCGSKLRDPSQNIPSVASKRDVNKTKLLIYCPVSNVLLLVWSGSLESKVPAHVASSSSYPS